MNASWLLFKTLRRGLLICAALCFLAQFLLVYADIRPSDLDKAVTLQFLSAAFALLFACFAGFHTGLFKLPFPVTHRQLAWIPTLCLAALWAAGGAGALAGIGTLSLTGGPAYALPHWAPFLLAILKTFPLAFLTLAVADRLLRYLGLAAAGFVGFPVFFIVGDRLDALGALALYHYGWPLCIVLGVFFILEAPAHIAAMEYPALVKQGLVSTYVRTPGAPIRTPAIKIWADLLMALIALLVAILFLSRLGLSSGSGSVSMFLKIYLAGMAVLAMFGIRSAWRSAHANGFATGKTVVVFLMKCSLVLLPIAWVWGAKRGVVATCDRCRHYKFLWARHCPHCGHANQGNVVRVSPLHLWKQDKGMPLKKRQVSPRMLYRVIFPAYLLMFGLITGSGGHFRNETITLIPTQEGIETAFPEIREYLASVEDARDWLDAGGDEPLLLPERFRIEAQELGVQVLEIECYWLRWEDAGPVGERLKERLLEAFPNPQFNVTNGVSKSHYSRVHVNRAALPTFLDGAIHWVAQ